LCKRNQFDHNEWNILCQADIRQNQRTGGTDALRVALMRERSEFISDPPNIFVSKGK
jgi:hypothetical protein